MALKYSQGGETATILWLRSSNFMDRGVDLAWISAYPHEQEFLYPALTYLKPDHLYLCLLASEIRQFVASLVARLGLVASLAASLVARLGAGFLLRGILGSAKEPLDLLLCQAS